MKSFKAKEFREKEFLVEQLRDMLESHGFNVKIKENENEKIQTK